jgi:hypothetical protein
MLYTFVGLEFPETTECETASTEEAVVVMMTGMLSDKSHQRSNRETGFLVTGTQSFACCSLFLSKVFSPPRGF